MSSEHHLDIKQPLLYFLRDVNSGGNGLGKACATKVFIANTNLTEIEISYRGSSRLQLPSFGKKTRNIQVGLVAATSTQKYLICG